MSLSMLIHNAEDLTGDLPLLRSRGKGLQLSAIGSRHVCGLSSAFEVWELPNVE